MNQNEAMKSLASTDGFFRHWMSYTQRVALTQALRSEEGRHFVELLTDLKARIESSPKTYFNQDNGIEDPVVHLHYFRGGIDAWITERDVGDDAEGDGLCVQHQAFGKITLTGDKSDAEWGYISIQELIENEVELDLYWTPQPMSQVA